LADLAKDFGIAFAHHDAVEDARVTGMILIRAVKESGTSIDDWLVQALQPISLNAVEPIARDGNPAGPFIGEVAVFTGALSMPRREAADLAAMAGCEVDAGVTKRTTLLIVGDQDVTRLAPGHSKSTKHVKAEEQIAKGQAIRILRESDFKQMLVA
jgi:DNA polymerase-3 subunit epsilon